MSEEMDKQTDTASLELKKKLAMPLGFLALLPLFSIANQATAGAETDIKIGIALTLIATITLGGAVGLYAFVKQAFKHSQILVSMMLMVGTFANTYMLVSAGAFIDIPDPDTISKFGGEGSLQAFVLSFAFVFVGYLATVIRFETAKQIYLIKEGIIANGNSPT